MTAAAAADVADLAWEAGLTSRFAVAVTDLVFVTVSFEEPFDKREGCFLPCRTDDRRGLFEVEGFVGEVPLTMLVNLIGVTAFFVAEGGFTGEVPLTATIFGLVFVLQICCIARRTGETDLSAEGSCAGPEAVFARLYRAAAKFCLASFDRAWRHYSSACLRLFCYCCCWCIGIERGGKNAKKINGYFQLII